MNECKCGMLLRDKECNKCGRVYVIEGDQYIENKDKTTENIKKYILFNTSVTEHSSWGSYYDFPMASKQTIDAYIVDINSHRTCVNLFLEDFTNDFLIETRDKVEKPNMRQLPDNILKELGYKYIENNEVGL